MNFVRKKIFAQGEKCCVHVRLFRRNFFVSSFDFLDQILLDVYTFVHKIYCASGSIFDPF